MAISTPSTIIVALEVGADDLPVLAQEIPGEDQRGFHGSRPEDGEQDERRQAHPRDPAPTRRSERNDGDQRPRKRPRTPAFEKWSVGRGSAP